MDVFNLSEEQYVLGIQGTLVSLFLKPYYRIGKQTDRREVTDPEVQMPNLRGTPASVTTRRTPKSTGLLALVKQ